MGVEQNRAATKPSIYLAWRLSNVRKAGDADPVAEAHPTQTQVLPRLAASLVFARRATLTRWAEAHPTQTQRLPRLAALHHSQSGQRRAGGLKPTLRKPSVYLAWRLPIVRERATPTRWAEALLFAAIRVGVFSALGFVLAKGNPRFAGSLVCVVLCFSQF